MRVFRRSGSSNIGGLRLRVETQLLAGIHSEDIEYFRPSFLHSVTTANYAFLIPFEPTSVKCVSNSDPDPLYKKLFDPDQSRCRFESNSTGSLEHPLFVYSKSEYTIESVNVSIRPFIR